MAGNDINNDSYDFEFSRMDKSEYVEKENKRNRVRDANRRRK